ncbi:hypothetical protein SUGI_0308250 [Cryptomeria japonica]|nr:hypothetical protein SUGI_0308250 [Cryptomeria japonica]
MNKGVLLLILLQITDINCDNPNSSALILYLDFAETSCYGYNQRQFPAGNLFGAANDAILENQAACGRKYRIRCLSGTSNERVNTCRKRSHLVVLNVDFGK